MNAKIALALSWLGFVAFVAGGYAWAQMSQAQPTGGAQPYHYLSTASNNATSVLVGQHTLYGVYVINTIAAINYLRFYDTSAVPTCSSATGVVANMPVPFGSSSAGGGFSFPFSYGLNFTSGIGFCLTGGSTADNDNVSGAVGITINIAAK